MSCGLLVQQFQLESNSLALTRLMLNIVPQSTELICVDTTLEET